MSSPQQRTSAHDRQYRDHSGDNHIAHYTPTAKWLHWIMAVIIIAVWSLGFYLADLPRGPEKTALIQWHKAIGSLVLPLIVIRLSWRLTHRPPALPGSIPVLQQRLAHGLHWALYALMFAQPLSGWAMSSAFGFPVALGGLITLPGLIAKDEILGKSLVGLHGAIGWTLGLLVVGHIAMALKHHFVDKDTVLLRMAPRHRTDSAR
jgi:cytochrome b561